MSATVKVTLGEVESVYKCTYPLARAIEVILHHSDCAEEIEQEPCDDCISRQAAIDAMNEWEWQELYLPIHFKQLLEDLPPVKPKQSFEGMTNGEVMETVFPNAKVDRYIDEYERPSDYLIHIDDETYFTKEWWNAPYKGGAE